MSDSDDEAKYFRDAYSQEFEETDLMDDEEEEKEERRGVAPAVATQKKKEPRQARRWAFTFQLGKDRSTELTTAHAIQDYAKARRMGGIMTPEQAPETGTWHFQGALICKRPMSREEIQTWKGDDTIFTGVHLEPQKACWDANVKYCLKTKEPAYKFGDVDQIVEEMKSGKAGNQGKRTDWHSIRDKAKQGASLEELEDDDDICGTVCRYPTQVDRLMRRKPKKADPFPWVGPTGKIIRRPEVGVKQRRKKQRHLYVYGPSNMRKSGWLDQFAGKDVFYPVCGRELEGYEGEEFVIFDMWMPEWRLLEDLCNRNRHDIGKSARFKNVIIPKDQIRTIIITNNDPPEANFKGMSMQQQHAFRERFIIHEAKVPLPVPVEEEEVEEDPIV